MAAHKTEGPSTVLAFLGILVDTDRFELRLPPDKLARLQETLRSWSGKRSCTRKELESLLGRLSHAATVVRQGRTFLRQLFPLLSLDRAPHHYIRLNAGARADLLWWRLFLRGWNGTSFFPAATPSVEVVSDASGSYGCGAFSLAHGWFQIEWPESWQSVSIAGKELAPIVVAAALWGHQWRRSRVLFRSDNMAVITILNTCTARDPFLMHLLRCLVFYAASFRFHFMSEHIPGERNIAADAISRNNLSLFTSLTPQIPHVVVPQPVLDLLVTRRPDWAPTTGPEHSHALYSGGLSSHAGCLPQRYSRFCANFDLSPLPLIEHTLCQFVAFLSDSVGWGTIRSYLSALRFYQISSGLPDPSSSSFPRLSYVLKGIRKLAPGHSRARRLPITPDLLRKLHAVWSRGPPSFDEVMLWAACCLGFFWLHASGGIHQSFFY